MKKTGLVAGATQGIGLAATEALLNNSEFDTIFATHRKESDLEQLELLKTEFPEKLRLITLDAHDENTFIAMAKKIKSQSDQLHLCLNCIGFLHAPHLLPEKSLAETNPQELILSFQTNTITTLLLAKHLKPQLISSENSVFAALSARVGSLGDNKTGGWYSYRLSKAALNMCLKNISIEFNRLATKCTVLAIHPGTTDTQMTAPFLQKASKKYKIHSVEETANNILKIIMDAERKKYNGQFVAWNGELLPW